MTSAIGFVTALIALTSSAVAAQPETSAYASFFVLVDNLSVNPVDAEHVKNAVEMELTDKGLAKTSPDEADAVVVVHRATAAQHTCAAFYRGWGGWEWQGAGSRALEGTQNYRAGTIVADVFDARTKQLVWRGSANLHATNKAVHALFRHFPPADSRAGLQRSESAVTANGEGQQILFRSSPAVLLRIDGEPRYQAIAGTHLQRIVNTTALILRDESGMHYLRFGGKWLEGYDFDGQWSISGMPPEDAGVVVPSSAATDDPDLGDVPDETEPVPSVIVTTMPTELIVTDGPPQFVAFDDSRLLYVKNTSATVFREPTDQELYVRLPVGWFRAWTTNGRWERVSDSQLPADLAALRH